MAYVDKAKLMSRIEFELIRWGEREYNALQILGDIEDFPTADVVEVVRCKKCENCKSLTDQFGNTYYFCMKSANKAKVEADGFCSYGERRTDNDL